MCASGTSVLRQKAMHPEASRQSLVLPINLPGRWVVLEDKALSASLSQLQKSQDLIVSLQLGIFSYSDHRLTEVRDKQV